MSDLATYVVTGRLRLLRGSRVCAECGGLAFYRVSFAEFYGYCCSEPTHWIWLVEAIVDEAEWEGWS